MMLLIFQALALITPIGAAQAQRIEQENLVTENIPPAPAALRAALGRYQNTRAARLGGWLADGNGLFVITGFGETPQAHFVEAPGGALRQLTYLDEPVSDLTPSPSDANLVAYLLDAGGNENLQVYLFNRADGTTRRLSDGVGRKGSIVWSRDGEQLAWFTTTENSSRAIIAVRIADPAGRRTLFAQEGAWSPKSWSPDGTKLVLRNYISANESVLYVLKIDSGSVTQINPSDQKIAYGDVEFTHDGKAVYFTSDEEGEFLDFFRYNIATGKKKNLTRNIDWDVDDFEVSPSGSGFAFVVNEAGRSRLHFRTRFGRALPAPTLPSGQIVNMQYKPDGKWLAFTMDAAAAPADVYSVQVSRRPKHIERWTQSRSGGADVHGFVEPEFFSYPTFDKDGAKQREIPALIYLPLGEGPHPVIIDIHGGPEGQARPAFSSQRQFWVKELGAVIIRPNVRGSSGYGKSYLKLDNGLKRENAVKDIGALLDWISTQPDLDHSRVVVYGVSYGGYMALASLIDFNERLAGAVDIVGISNFVTFLENTSAYRRDLRRAEYGDERDVVMRAYLQAISPLNSAGKISKPILIAQGLNDPRVPASESRQMLDAIGANGGEPWFILAKNEGHGFKKKSNRDALSEALVLFFADIFGLKPLSEGEVRDRPVSRE